MGDWFTRILVQYSTYFLSTFKSKLISSAYTFDQNQGDIRAWNPLNSEYPT